MLPFRRFLLSSVAVPVWVLFTTPAPTVFAKVDLDFANSRYYGATLNDLTVSRASTGYASKLDGTLVSFASNIPRITDAGLLIEEARTNLALQSQTFDNATWTKSAASITANQVVAPDGTTTADLLTADGTANIHGVNQTFTGTAAPYVFSVYVKAGTGRYISLSVATSTVGAHATFDLGTGVVTQNYALAGAVTSGVLSTASIQSVGNGWYLLVLPHTLTVSTYYCLISASNTPTPTFDNYGRPSYTGSETYYVWGAQVEAGAFPTSYIPTTTASVARAADDISMQSIGSWFNQSAGSMVADFAPTTNLIPASGVTIAGFAQDGSNAIMIALAAANPVFRVYATSNQFLVGATTPNPVSPTKMGMVWASNDAVAFRSGQIVESADTSVVLPNNITALRFGAQSGWYGTPSHYLKRFTYWNSRISNASMQQVTAQSAPAWAVNSAATLDMDFAANRYFGQQLQNLTVSRASTGFAETLSGQLVSFATNTARRTDKGLLVEKAATNLFTRSQEFDNAAWGKATATATANAATAPDGTLTADKFIPDNAAGTAYFVQNLPGSTGAHTASVYAKAAELTSLRMDLYSVEDGNTSVVFNLADGTITSGSGGTVQALGNGWYRCSVVKTWTGLLTSAQVQIARNTIVGDGTSGLYIWGAQLEASAFLTSYIPTTTASVTRAADVISLTGTNFSSWFSAAGQGTIVAAYEKPFFTIQQGVFNTAGTSSTQIGGGVNAAGSANDIWYIRDAASAGISNTQAGLVADNVVQKTAGAWNTNDQIAVVNGGAPITSAAGGVIAGHTAISIGNFATAYLNGYLKRISYIPERVSNDMLRKLTLPDAVVDVNFAAQTVAGTTGGTLASLFSVTRASTGYAETLAGTLTNFASGAMRLTDRGLLVEPARTNLLLRSQTLDNASWQKDNGTISADAITAPDGTLTADAYIPNSGSVNCDFKQSMTTVAATAYTLSYYVKNGSLGTNWIEITAVSTSVWRAWFDLANGIKGSSSGSPTAYSITPLANGWYRVDMTFTAGTTTTECLISPRSADGLTSNITGNGTSPALYAWGAQFEAGAYASSYIATVASTVTRAADVITSTAIPAMMDKTQGSMLWEGSSHLLLTSNRFGQLDSGVNNNRLLFSYDNGAGSARLFADYSAANVANIGSLGIHAANQPQKLVAAWKLDDFAAVSSLGNTIGTDTSGNVPLVTTLRMGHDFTGLSDPIYISRMALYRTRLPDAVLKALTTSETKDFDLTTGVVTGDTLASLNVSRASTGYASKADGTLVLFPANVARRTDLGLLVEEARTNLFLRSQEIDNGSWTKTNTTVTADQAVAPDGTTTAEKLASNSASSLAKQTSQSVTLTGAIAVSFFAKAAEHSIIQIVNTSDVNAYANFNLATGAVGTAGTGYTATMTALVNGWYRCTLVGRTQAGAEAWRVYLSDSASAGYSLASAAPIGNGVYLWGAQAEAGSTATSYIPTTTATVTRAADQIHLLSTWQAPYSIMVDYVAGPGAGTADILNTNPSLSNNVGFYQSAGSATAFVWEASATAANTRPVTLGVSNKIAARFALNNVAMAGPGGTIGGLDTANIPGPITRVNMSKGTVNYVGAYLNGYIRRFRIDNYGLKDAELQLLTTATPHAWALADAAVDADFAGNRYFLGDYTTPAASFAGQFTISRASTGYAETLAGALTSFAVNVARITDKGLLIEEARTNLILRSQELDNASWTKAANGSTITANAISAPDGTLTADKVVEDTSTGTLHRAYSSTAVVTNASTYTYSVYAKAGERNWLALNAIDAGNNRTWFDLSTGTVGNNGAGNTATIQALANGWYRCSITRAVSGTSAILSVELSLSNGDVASRTGDGVSGLYAWGAQIEAGSFATSYIPTTTASVTRAADNVKFENLAASTLVQVAGTAFVQSIGAVLNNNPRLIGQVSGNDYRMYGEGSGKLRSYNGTTILDTVNSATWSNRMKSIIGWDSTGRSLVLNGGTVATDAAVPVLTSALNLGSSNGLNSMNGYVERFAVIPLRKPNATLQTMTV